LKSSQYDPYVCTKVARRSNRSNHEVPELVASGVDIEAKLWQGDLHRVKARYDCSWDRKEKNKLIFGPSLDFN